MGYIRNQLTVLTAHDYPKGTAAEMESRVNDLRGRVRPEMARLIVGPIEAAVNGDIFYVMLPDGGKEGWSSSYEGEEVRLAFTMLGPHSAVHLEWGDDDTTAGDGPFLPLEDPTQSPLDYHGRPWKQHATIRYQGMEELRVDE